MISFSNEKRTLKKWLTLFTVYAMTSFAVSMPRAESPPSIVHIASHGAPPLRIALGFAKGSYEQRQQVIDLIGKDLERFGQFEVIPKEDFITPPPAVGALPLFGDWRLVDAQLLVTGEFVKKEAEEPEKERLIARFRLWDVYDQKELLAKEFELKPEGWQSLAHVIADRLSRYGGGSRELFDSRLILIESSEDPRKKRKLVLMDQDGGRRQELPVVSDMVMSPRFSPNNESFIYVAFENYQTQLYLYDLATGNNILLGDFPNLASMPRYSPDGRKLLLSLVEEKGAANIYTLDLLTLHQKQLTFSNSALNISASYSPNGKFIVFSSTSSGVPQLYVMNAQGGGVARLSPPGGAYFSPLWSPEGDYIAFTRLENKMVTLGVMKLDGSDFRLLAEGKAIDHLTWAPNGGILVYRKTVEEGSKLYFIDIFSGKEQLLETAADALEADWSSILHKPDRGS